MPPATCSAWKSPMAGNHPKQPRKALKKPARAAATADRPEIVHSSIYLPKSLHRALREIAFERDCKIHDLIIEGINAVIERHNEPKGRKSR